MKPFFATVTVTVTGIAPRYEVQVPVAGRLYDEHLEQLRKEGLIDGKEV